MKNKTLLAAVWFFTCLSVTGYSQTPTAQQCIAQMEGGNAGYNAVNQQAQYAGKYQFGVSELITQGYCTPSPIVINGVTCTRGYWQCNIDRNLATGQYKHLQHWDECNFTAKATALGVTTGNNSTNLQQFLGNQALQDAVYADYDAQATALAQNLYNTYNSQCGGQINGVPMTVDNIRYVLHHGGAGASSYISSCGARGDKCDNAFTPPVCLSDSFQKMDNCMNGRDLNFHAYGCGIVP